MIQALIGPMAGLIGKAIDKAVPDKAEAARLKSEVTSQAMSMAESELKGAVQIITAEANGESWLQRNWRPMVMIWLSAMVGLHWMGFTPSGLTESEVAGLLQIVQYGLSGYVVGRSGEKIMKAYKN